MAASPSVSYTRDEIVEALHDLGYACGSDDALLNDIQRTVALFASTSGGTSKKQDDAQRRTSKAEKKARASKTLQEARNVLEGFNEFKTTLGDPEAWIPLSHLARHASVQSVCSSRKTVDDAITNLRTDDNDALVCVSDFVRYLSAYKRAQQEQCPPPTRPVLQPLPGELPFKHDPVQRYAEYAEEWRRNPPPGSDPRKRLRWMVRDYMTRIDQPVLKRRLGQKNC